VIILVTDLKVSTTTQNNIHSYLLKLIKINEYVIL